MDKWLGNVSNNQIKKPFCIPHLVKKSYAFGAFQLHLYVKESNLWHYFVPRRSENSESDGDLYFLIVSTDPKSWVQNSSSLTMKWRGIYWPADFNLHVKCSLEVLHSSSVCTQSFNWSLELQYFRTEGKRFNYLKPSFFLIIIYLQKKFHPSEVMWVVQPRAQGLRVVLWG